MKSILSSILVLSALIGSTAFADTQSVLTAQVLEAFGINGAGVQIVTPANFEADNYRAKLVSSYTVVSDGTIDFAGRACATKGETFTSSIATANLSAIPVDLFTRHDRRLNRMESEKMADFLEQKLREATGGSPQVKLPAREQLLKLPVADKVMVRSVNCGSDASPAVVKLFYRIRTPSGLKPYAIEIPVVGLN